MSPTITPAGGPHLRAEQDLVLIGMFLLGCGVLLIDGVLHVHVTQDALRTMLLLCPMLVRTEEDWSATELAKVSEQLLRDPGQLAEMGRRAAAWARQCFALDRYELQAAARLL